jgi:hypothetical protein
MFLEIRRAGSEKTRPRHGALVFTNEIQTTTNITRTHGQFHEGERLRMELPQGHRKTLRA